MMDEINKLIFSKPLRSALMLSENSNFDGFPLITVSCIWQLQYFSKNVKLPQSNNLFPPAAMVVYRKKNNHSIDSLVLSLGGFNLHK
jgi:hypothetical protein